MTVQTLVDCPGGVSAGQLPRKSDFLHKLDHCDAAHFSFALLEWCGRVSPEHGAVLNAVTDNGSVLLLDALIIAVHDLPYFGHRALWGTIYTGIRGVVSRRARFETLA